MSHPTLEQLLKHYTQLKEAAQQVIEVHDGGTLSKTLNDSNAIEKLRKVLNNVTPITKE